MTDSPPGPGGPEGVARGQPAARQPALDAAVALDQRGAGARAGAEHGQAAEPRAVGGGVIQTPRSICCTGITIGV